MTTTQYSHRAHTTVATINALATKRTLAILAGCLALLAPGIVSAKKPAASVDAQCALFIEDLADPQHACTGTSDPQYVCTGELFLVKLVRVPSYPGAFHQPTVSFDVTYPMASGGVTTITYEFDPIPKFNVTYVEYTLPVLSMSQGIAINGEVAIEATVSEPLSNKNGNKTREKITKCNTTATVVQKY